MATTTKPMPVFWADRARAHLGEDRFERALEDPLSLDLLAWNVFQTLETHYDEDWLAYRLQQFGGTGVTAPVRVQLWTGEHADPLLQPSRGYVAAIRERASAAGATEADLAQFRAPIEVPVRIESPDVLCLVDTVLDELDRGTKGRDRLLELIDAGIEHARHLSKTLAVAVVYAGGSPAARQLSVRMEQLRRDLPRELPHQPRAGDIQLREVSWGQLLRVWESEVDYLQLPSSPRPFLEHVKRNGLY
ncbi:hypothetical protein [Euzebya sp.]|uniref:hypothetical protein n=1 Tax=Euzebya sp. TaxID=1971409 RepID=UPI0035191697